MSFLAYYSTLLLVVPLNWPLSRAFQFAFFAV